MSTNRPFIARNIRRFSVIIIFAWVGLAVSLNVVVPQLEIVGEENSVPLAPSEAPSTLAIKRMGNLFHESDSNSVAMLLLESDKPLDKHDHDYYDELIKQLEDDREHIQHIQNFWKDRATTSAVQSADDRAAYALVNLAGDQGSTTGNESVEAVVETAEKSQKPPGLKVHVTGPAPLTADLVDTGDKSMVVMTGVTIVVIAILLFIAYKSFTTVLLFLSIIFTEVGAARGVVAVLGSAGLIPLSTFATNLLTSLAIAAGTDYAIFLIGRYHEARHVGHDPENAYYDAFGGVAHVILGSGLTVAGVLFCLNFCRVSYFKSLGMPTSIGLIVVLTAGLTFAPAVLTVAGRHELFERKRKLDHTPWRRLATVIVRWPKPVLLVALAIGFLGVLALPGYETNFDDRKYLPDSTPSNEGFAAAKKHFTIPRMLPDLLLVESDHDMRNPTDMLVLDRIAKYIFRIPGIARVQSVTRPFGRPSEHSSVPFQVSMGSTPFLENVEYLKNRTSDILRSADDLGTTIGRLESSYALLAQLTNTADSFVADSSDTKIIADEIRDDLADFDDFFRPVRNYFYWEEHCYTIPICWAMRSLFNSLDGADKLSENIGAILNDAREVSALMPQLRDQLPAMIMSSKDIKARLLAMHSTFLSLIVQIERLTDTATVMGHAFDEAKNDDFFYLPPEAFENPDFIKGMELTMSPDGRAARMIITHAVDPASEAGLAHVDDELAAAKEAVKESNLADAGLYLAGMGATFRDIQFGANFDLLIAAAASLTLIFVVMLVLTGALVPAIVIVGTVLLSLTTAVGFSVFFWQYVFGLQLHWVVVLLATITLLAVGSDYNLMLVTRLKEEIGAGIQTGIIRGVGGTGGVVTTAGLVFAFTMGSMLSSQLRVIGQVGSTICLGLLFDTLVVRALITPSIATLLGPWFWWPKRVRSRPANEPDQAQTADTASDG